MHVSKELCLFGAHSPRLCTFAFNPHAAKNHYAFFIRSHGRRRVIEAVMQPFYGTHEYRAACFGIPDLRVRMDTPQVRYRTLVSSAAGSFISARGTRPPERFNSAGFH